MSEYLSGKDQDAMDQWNLGKGDVIDLAALEKRNRLERTK